MIYAISDKLSSTRLAALLADGMDVRVEVSGDIKRYYLDTFDWRLFKAGMVLEVEVKGGLCLLTWRELGSGQVYLSRTVRRLPKSADDFSNAGMQPRLKQVLGRRTLMTHASLQGNTDKFLLLNEEDKTLMRVELRRDSVISSSHMAYIRMENQIHLVSYRGYEKVFRSRMSRITRKGGLHPATQDPLLSVLDSLNITPGEYSGRPEFLLDPSQSSIDALSGILGKFFHIMEVNVKGAREDDDPEYLHDFLIAVRRIRCLLSSFTQVFPENGLRPLERDLQWVEQEVTKIRDLDIYMSLFDEFTQRVDEEHRRALKSLYSFLQSEKQDKIWQMRVVLESSRYLKFMESLSRYLRECKGAENLPRAAYIPIDTAARGSIWAFYRDLSHGTRRLSATTKAEEICQLHQISKRLGYHMDLFRSLFPAKRMLRLVQEQEKLQRRLNQFRDLDLQYRGLRDFSAKMKGSQEVLEISVEAVEQLIMVRNHEKAMALDKAVDQLQYFTRKKMRNNFKSMFEKSARSGDV